MTAKRSGNPWRFAAVVAVPLTVVAILFVVQPPTSPGGGLIRVASLLGYQAVFLAIVSTAYMRRMLYWFGRPFIKVHHLLSLSGLALLVLHPLLVALDWGTARYLVPQLGSPMAFLRYGGAPALYLLLCAALVAAFRKAIGPRWRWLHVLTYVAFIFATIHAFMLGSDFSGPVVRAVASAMLAAVLYVALRRHLKVGKRPARSTAGH